MAIETDVYPKRITERLAVKVAELVEVEEKMVADLSVVRSQKERAIQELIAHARRNGNGNGSDQPEKPKGKESVYQLLTSEAGETFTTASVAERLGMAANIASAYLSDLYKNDKRIERVAKGRYRALSFKVFYAAPAEMQS
jgi:hypothetical protein